MSHSKNEEYWHESQFRTNLSVIFVVSLYTIIHFIAGSYLFISSSGTSFGKFNPPHPNDGLAPL
jgi:hypothetical protein